MILANVLKIHLELAWFILNYAGLDQILSTYFHIKYLFRFYYAEIGLQIKSIFF